MNKRPAYIFQNEIKAIWVSLETNNLPKEIRRLLADALVDWIVRYKEALAREEEEESK